MNDRRPGGRLNRTASGSRRRPTAGRKEHMRPRSWTTTWSAWSTGNSAAIDDEPAAAIDDEPCRRVTRRPRRSTTTAAARSAGNLAIDGRDQVRIRNSLRSCIVAGLAGTWSTAGGDQNQVQRPGSTYGVPDRLAQGVPGSQRMRAPRQCPFSPAAECRSACQGAGKVRHV